jgi:hypothetical protein
MSETFSREKPAGACLSGWALSRLAAGGPDDPAARAHAASCRRCGALLEEERAEIDRAAAEPLPAGLTAALARPDRRRRRATRVLLPAVAALGALALLPLVLRPRRDPAGERTKGAVAVTAAVRRDARIWQRESPVDALAGRLRPGDELRLRLAEGASGARWALVEGLEEADGRPRWETYFDGRIPADGWLPIGVAITQGGRTRLRLTVCAGAPAPRGSCQTSTWDL